MKKIFCMIVSLTLLLTMFATTPLTAQAETYEKTIDGITYKIDTTTGEATVSGCYENIEIANIQSEVDGYKVTTIGLLALPGNEFPYEVIIPDSVTTIGPFVFNWCYTISTISVSKDNPIYSS